VSKIAVDTGVFVEYIDRKATYHKAAKAIIDSFGKLEVLLPAVIISEVCYVTARILNAAGVENAFEKATEFVSWLYSHPAVRIVNDLNLHNEAARIKLEYGIALADCYVLALSRIEDCKAVFRKRERDARKDRKRF
jgi:predicted nucleic acid-binding protein